MRFKVVTFSAADLKPSSYLQLEELHRMSEMNEATGDMAREELRESTLRIESLSAQLAGIQREVDIYFPC